MESNYSFSQEKPRGSNGVSAGLKQGRRSVNPKYVKIIHSKDLNEDFKTVKASSNYASR